jgi:hypothetical protein
VPPLLADALSKGNAKRFYANSHGNIGRFFVAG